MTHWDGLSSSNSSGEPQRICILGATNRIQDIDEAILRRMPKKFPVSLPSAHQRRGIFKLILRDTKLDRAHFDLDYLVKISAGMSGSDIKEACRDAAMCPVREYINIKKAQGKLKMGVNPDEVRGIRTEDFFGKGSGLAFEGLGAREKQQRRSSRAAEIDVDSDPEFETESDSQSEEVAAPAYKDEVKASSRV
jgi:SpoVK/Ycf46/Vps4 family AAA+-type ATPase